MHAPLTDPPELFSHEPVPPDLLAWARQTFDPQEYLDGVRGIEATGGHTLESFIEQVEARATKS